MFDINKAKELTKARKECIIIPELERLIDNKIEWSARAGDDSINITITELCKGVGMVAMKDITVDSYLMEIKRLYEDRGYRVKIEETPIYNEHFAVLSWAN